MMHFGLTNMVQDITYWAPGVQNEYGQVGFAAPIKIKGRWEGKVQQVRKPDGEEITSTAHVFVDRLLAVLGYIALGDLTADQTPPDTAKEIQSWNSHPDLRNLGTIYEVFV